MALKWNVDSLDELSPEQAALYVADPQRGGYRLDVTEPEQIKKALVVERGARDDAIKQARTAEAQRAIDVAAAQKERDAAVAKAQALRTTLLDLHVRRAAKEAGLHDAAVADALRAAREFFDVGDDGAVRSKDGKLKVDEWFAQAQESSPHWFPVTGRGSGAVTSTREVRASANGMTRQQFEALAPAQRAALVREGKIQITE